MRRRDSELSCRMYTSRNRAWKTCFCTTPAGVYANELEGIFCAARSRRARGAAESGSTHSADIFAAAVVRLYFWARDGGQWLHASRLQEPAAAWNHGHQHGVHGRVGGSDAAHC